MANLTVDGLIKEFGEITAVDDFSIEIEDGEFIVIVGPSGCGKTTTLNCIAGLEEPTEGEVVLGSESITHASPQERDIAMVFQSYALYPHMNIYDNLAFGLRMSTEYDSDEIDRLVTETAGLLGIEEQLENRPSELSGGQRQRVALGRAIVRDPDLFLMDEPLSNLDAKLRTEMRTELLRLQNELGVTTIYVTHDQTEAMTMADRIAVMNEGVLQQVASPLDLYYEPANRFVAEFIGDPSMNVFEMELEPDDVTHLSNDRFELEITDDSSLPASVGSVDVGIRPEAIAFADKAQSGTNVIEARVDVVEPMGDVTHVHFSVGSKNHTATVPGRTIPEEGRNVRLRFPAESLYVFEKTGEAIRHPCIDDDERTVADVY